MPELFTEATDGSLLLHTPPFTPPEWLKLEEEPAQIEDGPEMVPGFAARLTAIIWLEVEVPQPLETVYFIVAFPVEIPVTTPVFGSTVATDGVTLVHVPPAEPSLV
jgi:hypothetical protein